MTNEQWQRESDLMAQHFQSPEFLAHLAALRAKEAIIAEAKRQAAAALNAQAEAKREAERLFQLAGHQVRTITQGRIKNTAGARRLALMLLTASKEAREAL